LEKFKWCCEQHHCTPWKNEITRRLIESKDAAGLQRLTDLSTQVHGEVNSLYDLVFAFVECGRIKQARKILEVYRIKNHLGDITNNKCFCLDSRTASAYLQNGQCVWSVPRQWQCFSPRGSAGGNQRSAQHRPQQHFPSLIEASL
jgi:hypothetical protein